MALFQKHKSLTELQEEDEILETELSVARKKAAIKEVERRGGNWQMFSDNGQKSGINFGRVWAWLKTH